MRGIIIAAILVIAQVAPLAAVSPVEILYQKANNLFVAKRFSESAATLQEVLRLDPKLVPGWILKGKLALAAGQTDIARACLEQAVTLDPRSAYAQFMLGFYWYYENDFKRALPQLEKARALNENDANPVLYLAMTEEALGFNDEALRYYEEAEDLDAARGKMEVETLLAHARLLFTLSRLEASEKRVDQALAIDPKSRNAHWQKGRLLLEYGDAAGAVQHGELALEIQGPGPADHQVHELLARGYAAIGESGKSELHLEAAKQR